MILICGLPNAGKTTFSQRYDNVIHLDDYRRSYDGCHEAIRKMDKSGELVVEGVYLMAKNRKNLLTLAGDGRKICIWLDVPVEVCDERETRGRGDIASRLLYKLEEPTLEEGWDEIIRIRSYDAKHHLEATT